MAITIDLSFLSALCGDMPEGEVGPGLEYGSVWCRCNHCGEHFARGGYLPALCSVCIAAGHWTFDRRDCMLCYPPKPAGNSCNSP